MESGKIIYVAALHTLAFLWEERTWWTARCRVWSSAGGSTGAIWGSARGWVRGCCWRRSDPGTTRYPDPPAWRECPQADTAGREWAQQSWQCYLCRRNGNHRRCEHLQRKDLQTGSERERDCLFFELEQIVSGGQILVRGWTKLCEKYPASEMRPWIRSVKRRKQFAPNDTGFLSTKNHFSWATTENQTYLVNMICYFKHSGLDLLRASKLLILKMKRWRWHTFLAQ